MKTRALLFFSCFAMLLTSYNYVCYAKEAESKTVSTAGKTTLFFHHSSEFLSFEQEFNKKFKNRDIWLALANDGEFDPYIERFKAKNWLFWSDPLRENILGISGNYLKESAWQQLSKSLSKKISYIAVDFNELITHRHRTKILQAAAQSLEKGGIFCLEDMYDSKTQKFVHLSKEDLDQLSQHYDIKFALHNGFVAALPYGSDLSANQKRELFSGLELCLLKLSAYSREQRRTLGLNLSNGKLNDIPRFEKAEIISILTDLINDREFEKLVAEYKSLSEQITESQTKEKTLQQQIEDADSDLENFNKLKEASDKIGKTVSTTASKALSLIQKIKFFNVKVKQQEEKNEESTLDIKIREKLELKNKLNFDLMIEKSKISALQTYLQDVELQMIKRQDYIFLQLTNDKLLAHYEKYKLEKASEIVEKYSKQTKTLKAAADNTEDERIEALANSLRNAWSPKFLMSQAVDFNFISGLAEKAFNSKLKVLVLFVKK